MDDLERKKWAKALTVRDKEIVELRRTKELAHARISKLNSDYLGSLSRLVASEQEVKGWEERYRICERNCNIKIHRARERVEKAERGRELDREAVEELTQKVALANNLAILPQASFYLPEPIVSPVARGRRESNLLDNQDEAYVAAILTGLTSELAYLRAEKEENERNFQHQVDHLHAQVAHRDHLLEQYILSVDHPTHISPAPLFQKLSPRTETHQHHSSGDVSRDRIDPTEALRILNERALQNRQLEEDIKVLGRKLELAQQKAAERSTSRSMHETGSPFRSPQSERESTRRRRRTLQDTRRTEDVFDKDIEEARHAVQKVQATVEQLRERVAAVTGPEASHENNGCDDQQENSESTIVPQPSVSSQSDSPPLLSASSSLIHLSPDLRPGASPLHRVHRSLPHPILQPTQQALANKTQTLPAELLSLQAQINTATSELHELNTEHQNLLLTFNLPLSSAHHLPTPDPQAQIAASVERGFDTILLIEEECLRLQVSEKQLKRELESTMRRLEECRACGSSRICRCAHSLPPEATGIPLPLSPPP